MKKKVFCLLAALLLALTAAGCGMDRAGSSEKDLLPDSAPMISPARGDGVVRDQDGFIGNGDQSGVKPSPSASPTPSSSPMPTTAPAATPTAAPGTSPKP